MFLCCEIFCKLFVYFDELTGNRVNPSIEYVFHTDVIAVIKFKFQLVYYVPFYVNFQSIVQKWKRASCLEYTGDIGMKNWYFCVVIIQVKHDILQGHTLSLNYQLVCYVDC